MSNADKEDLLVVVIRVLLILVLIESFRVLLGFVFGGIADGAEQKVQHERVTIDHDDPEIQRLLSIDQLVCEVWKLRERVAKERNLLALPGPRDGEDLTAEECEKQTAELLRDWLRLHAMEFEESDPERPNTCSVVMPPVMQKHPVALLVFSAGWCRPCRQQMPVLRSLGVPVYVYDADRHKAALEHHGVRFLPTVCVSIRGREFERHQGLPGGPNQLEQFWRSRLEAWRAEAARTSEAKGNE